MDQALPLEELDGVVGGHGALLNGQRLGGQLPHPLLDPVQKGLVQGKVPLGADEQGAAEGVLHAHPLHLLPARHVVERLEHQEDRAALIGLDAGNVPGGDHFQGAVPVQGLVELAELPVPVHQQDITGKPLLEVRRHGAAGRPVGIGAFLALYRDLHHSLFVHMTASYL